jgi:hypothetical protein
VAKARTDQVLLAAWLGNYHLLLCMVSSAQVRLTAAVNG